MSEEAREPVCSHTPLFKDTRLLLVRNLHLGLARAAHGLTAIVLQPTELRGEAPDKLLQETSSCLQRTVSPA